MEKEKRESSVIKSAFAMSLGTILSRILGLLRDMVLAAYFSRTVTDAFVVAFRLPNMFRRLLGEGSLSVSFIPIYIESRNRPSQENLGSSLYTAQILANGIFTLLVLTTGILSIGGILWMPKIMDLLVGGSGYRSVGGKFELTVWLARIMFGYLFLVTLYAYYMAIANAWKKFLIPALAPAIFNVVCILFSFIPDGAFGRAEGEYLAWGVLMGGLMQAILVGLLLKKMKILPRFRKKPWEVPHVKRVLINMLPGIAGLGILQIIAVVNVSLASELPEGAHSFIYWGDRILELPQAIIAVSLGAALLPTLSQLYAEGKHKEMLQSATHHLQLLLFLTVPAALGLLFIAQPLSEAIFMRGQFTLNDATTTARVIQIYTILLLASSFSRVLVPSFYARKNTWLPSLISAFTLIVHIGVALAMTKAFGLYGLVGATTVSGVFNVIALSICYRWLIGPLGVQQIVISSLRWIPGLLLMSLWLFFMQEWFFSRELRVGNIERCLYLMAAVIPGLLFYLGVSALLNVSEAAQVVRLFRRKWQKQKQLS